MDVQFVLQIRERKFQQRIQHINMLNKNHNVRMIISLHSKRFVRIMCCTDMIAEVNCRRTL